MTKNKLQSFIPITIISVLFFIFGFITWLNGILIPYLKIACELTDFQSLFVAFAFYISYTIMALPSSFILQKTGFKKGMTLGLIVMSIGSALFIPAALGRTYILFLTGLFVLGTGLAILQTATNPYITILGPQETAARRISIMGICNKIAGALAPLVLAYFILQDGDAFVKQLQSLGAAEKTQALDQLAQRVILPYTGITIALFLLGIGLLFTPLPEIETEEDTDSNTAEKGSILQFPHLILGAIALFFYVGVEVVAGDTIIRYGISQGIDISYAKAFTSYTLTAMIVGYVLGIILMPKIISQRTALTASAILGIILTIGAIVTTGYVSVLCIALLGLANALVWPAIWPLAIHNLGAFLKQGSAILIMAIAGGAILPLAWGKLADIMSPQMAYIIMVPAYLIILYFSLWGYKKEKW